jgi:hypothetical protein
MRRFAISGVVCLPSLIAAVALADAPLRLNEIRLEQPGADTDEYIEIAGAPGESLAGVSIIVIGDDDFALPGQQNGFIEDVIPLSGAVPASGFFVVAEPKFSLGIPNLVADLNLEGGDNVTFILVRDFTGFEGQKLDTNDDGTLDVTPWTSVVGSVAVVQTLSPNGGKSDYFYSTTTVGPDAGQQPAAAWLCANTSQWIIGTQDPLGGVDSPGAANQLCVPQGVILSEIRIDQPGTVPDPNEYFELKGAPGQSLDGYTFITIGDGTGSSGVIENIVPLNGRVIAADGFLSVAESTFPGSPGFGEADVVLTGTNPINFENSDNVTHLLVQGFTGTNGQDLDTNNDGVLDLTPWTSIADSVAMTVDAGPAPSANEVWWYSAARVGPDGTFVPGHIYRCTTAGTWLIGPFGAPQAVVDTAGGANAICTTCGPGAGNCHAVHATPGCVDTSCCNLVIGVDPTCGTETWDQACVDLARQFCLVAGAPPVLSLNEIRLDEVSTTDPNEYIEIKGTPGASLNGVSVVVVGDGADLNGSVETVISLNGSSIPKDGIFLLAKSATPIIGTPDLARSFNLENGDTVTYFLVWNWTGLINTDYDLDGNCALDSLPWDATIDSVGISADDGRCVYSAATVGPDYVGLPAHVVKCTDGSWRFGRFDAAATDGFGTPGTANAICPPAYACGIPNGPSCFAPQTVPGCSDEVCCASVCAIDVTCCELVWDASCAEQATLNCFIPSNPPDVKIGEIRIDQTSFDEDEYFEIVGTPNTLLNGLTYIVIGDGTQAAGSGVVEYALSLNGNRIPDSGFFLAARSTFNLGTVTPNLILPTNPELENSDNVTHMLVWGFTGAINQDLDTDDDGELDVTPWLSMLQSVAFIENAATPPVNTEYAYGSVRVGPDPNGFVPSQLAYCPSTDTWSIGTFDPAAKTAIDTPGAPNPGCEYASTPCPADLDGDGAVGASDLATLLGAWGSTKGGSADIDGDGSIGAADLSTLLAAWGNCP